MKSFSFAAPGPRAGALLQRQAGRRWLPLRKLLFHGTQWWVLASPRWLPSPPPGHVPLARPALCSLEEGPEPRCHQARRSVHAKGDEGSDKDARMVSSPPTRDREIGGLSHQKFFTGCPRVAAHWPRMAIYTSLPLSHLFVIRVRGAGAQPRGKGRGFPHPRRSGGDRHPMPPW